MVKNGIFQGLRQVSKRSWQITPLTCQKEQQFQAFDRASGAEFRLLTLLRGSSRKGMNILFWCTGYGKLNIHDSRDINELLHTMRNGSCRCRSFVGRLNMFIKSYCLNLGD